MLVLLSLLAALPAWSAKAPTALEAPRGHTYVEASPEMLARRKKACYKDLGDFQAKPTAELVDRLLVCMETPDATMRAEFVDKIANRRLWDLPDYEQRVRPALEAVQQRYSNDPDLEVRHQASGLGSWLSNAENWRNESSPQAQERQRREEEESRRQDRERDWETTAILIIGGATGILWLVTLGLGFLRGRRRRR
jgi:hypothetical protein